MAGLRLRNKSITFKPSFEAILSIVRSGRLDRRPASID